MKKAFFHIFLKTNLYQSFRTLLIIFRFFLFCQNLPTSKKVSNCNFGSDSSKLKGACKNHFWASNRVFLYDHRQQFRFKRACDWKYFSDIFAVEKDEPKRPSLSNCKVAITKGKESGKIVLYLGKRCPENALF